MSATVSYSCDRCADSGSVPALEGTPIELPTGWIRLGLEAVPVKHLCPGCAAGLDSFLAHGEPVAAAEPAE